MNTKTIDLDNIATKYSIGSYCDYDRERSNIYFQLEIKNGKFPFSFVGRGLKTISDCLEITEKQALDLLILKYSEILESESVKDTRIREALKRKIHNYRLKRGDFQVSKQPHTCRCCGKIFFPKNFRRKYYCEACSKIPYWKRKKYRKQAKNGEKKQKKYEESV